MCGSAMPYGSNDELPPAVANHLPSHAQDIFREAFNHAWDEYGGDEERAFRVGWAAVKRSYRKRGTDWVAIKSQRHD
ncbi:MAG TPA: ChaB family protein [Acetobacteraceae bacterium]